jgi:C1A family cysteine protease
MSGKGLGWRKDQLDPRDHIYAVTQEDLTRLPKHHSVRDKMPGVYDQGQLGSCTGNAIAGAMEYNQIQAGQDPITPSRLYIYWHEREMEGTVSQDAGAEIRDGLKVVANLGVPPESDWPYDISRFADPPPSPAETDAALHKATSYKSIQPGPGAPMRTALAQGHPVVFGFVVIEAFESLDPSNPVLRLPQRGDRYVGGHAVLAVGYDFTRQRFPVNVVEVRNSWGTSWGEDGYFYMDAQYFNNQQLTSDFWVVSSAT